MNLTSIYRPVVLASALTLSGAMGAAHAQSLENVLRTLPWGDAVDAVRSLSSGKTTSEKTSSPASPSATPVGGKPANWPSHYIWRDYTQTAPQPVYNGKIRLMKKKGLSEAVDFKTMPLQHAIVRVRGNGKRKMAIFSDPTCPVSSDLEKTLNTLDDVTIYTFVVPVLPNKLAPLLSEQIMCRATNRERAHVYENLMINKVDPIGMASCTEAAETVKKAKKSFTGLTGPNDGMVFSNYSPVVFLENGYIIPGLLTKSEFEDYLSR